MNPLRLRPHTANLCRVGLVAGLLTLIVGLFLAPQRAWANLLIASFCLTGLGLGAAIFLAMHDLAGAGWATALRRVPEAMFPMIALGSAGMLAVFLFRPSLYPWTQPSAELEPLMHGFKGFWLDRGFFLGRAVFYIGVWLLLAWRMLSISRARDRGDQGRSGPTAALFTVSFGITFCLASFDWVMSLEPAWFSTIFGLYNFAGSFVAALSLITVMVIWLRRRGDYQNVLNGEHLHDFGKLIMGFATVWAYILFSQYMLIWYSNMPEETGYYALRRSGAWDSLFFANIVINWAIPFLVLLPVQSKRSSSVMAKVAVVLLVGRWLDVYLLVMPPTLGDSGPRIGIWEIGTIVALAALIPLLLVRSLRAAPLIPEGDPRLAQSLHYHS